MKECKEKRERKSEKRARVRERGTGSKKYLIIFDNH